LRFELEECLRLNAELRGILWLPLDEVEGKEKLASIITERPFQGQSDGLVYDMHPTKSDIVNDTSGPAEDLETVQELVSSKGQAASLTSQNEASIVDDRSEDTAEFIKDGSASLIGSPAQSSGHLGAEIKSAGIPALSVGVVMLA
jgi:hypothetical protein